MTKKQKKQEEYTRQLYCLISDMVYWINQGNLVKVVLKANALVEFVRTKGE